MLGGLVVRQVVEQDCAKNGALGLNICRQRLRGNVISGRQLNRVGNFQESFHPARS
jgi:hypothetical protein